jgi:hypothetical protein
MMDKAVYEEASRVTGLMVDVFNQEKVTQRIGMVVALNLAISSAIQVGMSIGEFFTLVSEIYSKITGGHVETMMVDATGPGTKEGPSN